MNRYSTTSIRCYKPAEDPNGEWVRHEDAATRIAALEAQLAEAQAEVKRWEGLAEQAWKESDRAGTQAMNYAQQLAEAQADVERYRKWKENGLSYSNGYYHLDLYMYNPDGIREYGNADDIADEALEAMREGE